MKFVEEKEWQKERRKKRITDYVLGIYYALRFHARTNTKKKDNKKNEKYPIIYDINNEKKFNPYE